MGGWVAGWLGDGGWLRGLMGRILQVRLKGGAGHQGLISTSLQCQDLFLYALTSDGTVSPPPFVTPPLFNSTVLCALCMHTELRDHTRGRAALPPLLYTSLHHIPEKGNGVCIENQPGLWQLNFNVFMCARAYVCVLE